MRKTIITIFILFVVVLLSTILFEAFRFLNTVPVVDGQEELFTVQSGSFQYNAKKLQQEKFITNPTYFSLLARITGGVSKLRVGEFRLNHSWTPFRILQELTEGKIVEYGITIPEGYNIFEIADLLESKKLIQKEKFLQLCADKAWIHQLIGEDLKNIEGYLFPETYHFTKQDGEKKIIQTMVAKFRKVYEEIQNEKNILNTPMKENVILASIIEKETGNPEEREIISSVFHNRLRQKIRLQSDPTILYGLRMETGVWPTNIHKSDILHPTPYNTYTVPGLPVGAVSNPGRESLFAALNPKETDYLFFVSRNDGTHVFTHAYKDHDAAVKSFQKNAAARKNKSWRDLQKKKKATARP